MSDPAKLGAAFVDTLFIAFGGLVVLTWGCALLAAREAPAVADLYNLVYYHSRPAKGEGTGLFLFGFPAMLTVGLAISYVSLRRRARRGQLADESPLKLLFLLSWIAFFFIASMLRSWTVFHHRY